MHLFFYDCLQVGCSCNVIVGTLAIGTFRMLRIPATCLEEDFFDFMRNWFFILLQKLHFVVNYFYEN